MSPSEVINAIVALNDLLDKNISADFHNEIEKKLRQLVKLL